MAELIKVNKKVINDPLYTPVIKYLKDRIAQLELTGPQDELALSKQRYDGLVAGDLVIESAVMFPDNVVRVCIISRKTGFARVDLDIKYVQMDEILTDFAVSMVEINDVDHLKTYVKSLVDPVQPTLLYLKEKSTYGVLITKEQAKTHAGVMEAFGNLFFENYVTERESENTIDWETLESGTLTITDPSFGRGVYPLFIYELALSEAQLPEITSNLPASVTSRRGESFVIPNTYTFNGNQDITTIAKVELSTKSGYAILDRSSDLLSIDGDTIYGSSLKDIEDEIVVRVTYDWNGRLVHKNFTVKLVIEKDLVNDLTVTAVPSDVTAASGDTIQVTVTAKFKDKAVEILIPPNELKSRTGHSNLAYVKTNRDFSMVYQGKVNADFSGEITKVSDLASGEFSYSDNGSITKGVGYVNITIVKPEVLPKFTVTGVPTLIRGYINATGSYQPVIKYGDQSIPVTDVGITTGNKGSKQLLAITDVNTKNGVEWKLITDSATPGTPIRDTFTQVYQWLDPNGVLQTKEVIISVQVDLDSIITVVPVAPQPRNVKRYQVGGPTFDLVVNGVVQNGFIQSLTVDPLSDSKATQYIVNAKNQPNRWMVILAEDHVINYDANFTFTAQVDGRLQTFHFKQTFVIAKYPPDANAPVIPPDDNNPNKPGGGVVPGEKGTGPGGLDPIDNIDGPGEGEGPYNTNITAVPTSFTIAGDSDKAYSMAFKVYEGVDDVTANSEVIADTVVTPEDVTITSLDYDLASDSFVMKYYKNKGTESTGAIFVRKKNAATPLDKKDVARVWLNVNVVQVSILKLINAPSSTALNVDETKDLPLTLEYSGKPIQLTDPNLKIENLGSSDSVLSKIDKINANSLTLLNDIWTYVGKTRNETMPIRFTYHDAALNKDFTTTLSLNIAITYPAMQLVYDGPQVIDAKIWDTGTFPVRLVAGKKDWTKAMTATIPASGTKYVNINKLDWNVIFADKTATSQIVGFNVFYNVGLSIGESLPADFKFNLAAWDGVTFIADTHTPTSIDAKSGDTGEITASFLYKGNVATDTVVLNKAKSIIPATVILGTPAYDSARKLLVIPYSLTKGGNAKMTLVFSAPGTPDTTTSFDVDTKVEWPDDLNILTQGSNIRGFYQDTVKYPLTVNVAGTPVNLDDANMDITFSSGTDDPLTLEQILSDGLNVHLAKGGSLATNYNYTVTITLKYTNQATSKVYTKTLTVPATIRVSGVVVSSNPVIIANVFDHNVIPVTLADERGKDVPITSYDVNGAGTNVMLMAPNLWYVTNGLTSGQTTGELPLRLGYSMGGSDYTTDVTEKFTINKWDGIYYRVSTPATKLEGSAGDVGSIPFTFSYQGWAATGSTLDLSRSTIPNNINIGDLDQDGKLSYTLVGQADLDMTLYFVRPNPSSPQVEGRDFAKVKLPVSTKSSNLPFTLVSNDNAISLDWSKSGVINVKLMYGDNPVPANAPGLKFSLGNAEFHGITITGATKDGITVKATRSAVAGSTINYPENITVSYEVGAPDPKTVAFDVAASVSMGPVTISKNDKTATNIWKVNAFRQVPSFNGTELLTVDHFELTGNVANKYIELVPPKSYEVIGAEPTTTTQRVPTTMYYKVDSTPELQTLKFDADYEIAGSTSVRFKVTPTPTKLEGSLNNDVSVTVTPVYKDKNVGGTASFKPDLSTIPPQLTLKDYKVVGANYVITFTGAKAGLGKLKLVFWSPDAGTAPAARDVASCDVDVQIMGELGLEIGNRDNRITGQNASAGNYAMQILFGGIPIDAAASMTAGTLTAQRVVGAVNSSNANVLTLGTWQAESFDYTLAGCVQPNATVDVSDFILLTYKYGGTNYTATVEVPLRYTSSIPTFTGWPGSTQAIFIKSTVNPIAKVDGVDVSAGIASISNFGDTPDKYITWGGSAKTYEVIWAEKTQITHDVPTRIVGQYRIWPWSAVVDVPFTLAAWDQRTWAPTFGLTTWDAYIDLTGKASISRQLTAKYKNQIYSFGNRGNAFDESVSDLKGLVKVIYGNTPNFTTQNYTVEASKAGTGTAKLGWRRTDGNVPGVLDTDYGTTDLAVTIRQNSLVADAVSNPPKGGSGDTVTNASLVVRDFGTKTIVSNLNANLVIATVDESVIRLTGKTANTISFVITAPYTMADGPTTVPMTFKYTDPNTGYVTQGTFDYPLTLQRPADWPVVTQSVPTNKVLNLFDYGPNPFTISSNGQDVTASAVPVMLIDDMAGNDGAVDYMELSIDQPVAGTWWWITKKVVSSSQQTRRTKFKINVPYRGSTVTVDAVFTYIRQGDGSNPGTAFTVTTTQPKTLIRDVGEQTEIPFKVLWRKYKYGKAVFKPADSGTTGAAFSDYFKVVGQRYDDSDGTTYLKIEVVQKYSASMNFVFDMEGVTNPVVGTNRASTPVSFYDLDITLSTANTWSVWDLKRLPTMVTIKDGTTDLTPNCTITKISNAMFVDTTQNVNPNIQLVSDKPIAAQTVNVTYSIKLPAAYNGRVIDVIIPAIIAEYDGVEFVFVPFGDQSKANAPVGQPVGLTAQQWRFRNGSATDYTASSDADIKALNNGKLNFNSISKLSPSNVWVYSYAANDQIVGKIKIPVHYTGPGSTNWPKGTINKNYREIEVDATFYYSKLCLYPSDAVEPGIVNGTFGTIVDAPVQFSIGDGVAANKVSPAASAMSWVIQGVFQNGKQVTGIVSKPSAANTPSTSTGIRLQIDYDNRDVDVTVDVNVAMTYNGTFNGYSVTSTRVYKQQLLIKGTGAGDTIVTTPSAQSGPTWTVGSLPLAITQNGKAIPNSAVKSVTIAPNQYVRYPENNPAIPNRVWEIYSGEKGTNTVTSVNFTVVYNDGLRDQTVTQAVQFTVGPYDGTDMFVTPYGLNTFNNGIVSAINGTTEGNFKYDLVYKGTRPGIANFGVWNTKTTLPGFVGNATMSSDSTNIGQPSNVSLAVATYKAGPDDMEVSKDGFIYIGLYSKENDPTAVEGKDFVKVKLPSYVYNNSRLYIVSYDPTITGNYGNGTATGTKYNYNYRIRRGINVIQNNIGGSASLGSAITDPNLLFVAYDSNVGYEPVWFLKELTSAARKTTRVKFTLNPTGAVNLQSSFYVDVTQISNLAFPTVSGLKTVETNLNQSGGLPFKLTDDQGVDITSQATITAISSNDYIQLQNNKWYCYNARTGDTTTQVTLTYTITYKGSLLTIDQDVSYLVKGYTGQPTAGDVQVVNANVWDKGTAIPFNVYMNGSPVPASWITAVSGTSANNRVTVPSLANPWKVIAGDTTKAVSDTVSYIVTVSNGNMTWTVNQDVIFNINKYDGIEFKMKITNLSPTGDLIQVARKDGFNTTPPTPSNVTVNLQGTYRGEIITASPGFTRKDLITMKNMSGISLNNGSTGTKTWTIALTSATLVNAQNVVSFVRDGATGTVEGVDIVTLTIPITTYLQDTLQVGVLPTPIVGKFGDVIDVTGDLRYNGVRRLLNDTSYQAKVAISGTSVLEIVPNSLTAMGFKVRFKADVTTDTNSNTSFQFSTVEYPSTAKTVYMSVPVTQKAPVAVEPTLTELQSPMTMNLWDTRALSFKVMLSGTDITSSITDLLPTNQNDINDKFEFVKLADKSWGYQSVKSDTASQVKATAKFNVKVTYQGKDYVIGGSVDLVTNVNNGSIPTNRFNVEMM